MEIGDVVEIIEGEHKGKIGIIEEFPWNGYATVRIVNKHDTSDIPLNYLTIRHRNI